MAYTKSPTVDTHNTVRLPIQGSLMPSSSLSDLQGMKYYNCMPVTINTYGKDPEKVLMKRPYFEVSTLDPDLKEDLDEYKLLSYYTWNDQAIVVTGSGKVWNLSTGTMLFSLTGTEFSFVSMTSYLTTTGDSWLIIKHVDTATNNGYVTSWNGISATTSSALTGLWANGVEYLDGFIFVGDYRNIYNSSVSTPTSFTTANDFISPEQFPDQQNTLAKHKNHIVSLGQKSTEFFYDGAVQLGSPLLRQSSYAKQIGIVSKTNMDTANNIPQSTSNHVYLGDELYFIGEDEKNNFGIYEIEEFRLRKISNSYLDMFMNLKRNKSNLYNWTNIAASELYAIKCYGVMCIMLQLIVPNQGEADPSITYITKHFVYNPREDMWSEWILDIVPTVYIRGIFNDFQDTKILINRSGPDSEGLPGEPPLPLYDLFILENYSNESEVGAEVEARVVFDFFDAGIENFKHIKYVDFIGDFGNNLCTLEYSKATNNTDYTLAGSKEQDWKNYILRYRNLGKCRRIAFRCTFAGSNQIVFRGLDVAYNVGTF